MAEGSTAGEETRQEAELMHGELRSYYRCNAGIAAGLTRREKRSRACRRYRRQSLLVCVRVLGWGLLIANVERPCSV